MKKSALVSSDCLLKVWQCRFLFASLVLVCFASAAMADEGDYRYPKKKCRSDEERITCKSWFEQPDACDQYLKNSQYYISEGYRGASVQEYVFCKRNPNAPVRNNQEGLTVIIQNGLGVLFFILGAGVLLLLLRKKNV